MAEIWKPQPFEVLQHWVTSILTEQVKVLTPWERDFTEDMGALIKLRIQLSERQHAILERIYADKTS